MRALNSLRKKWSNPVEQRRLMDTLQVSFVALVWFVVFALVLATQGCAKKEEAQPKATHIKDLIIQEPTAFSSAQYLVVNRLILSRDGRIVTNGSDLRIEANEIISDEGVIEPFAEDTFAVPGTAGKNGGHIYITAKTGRGTLYIYGRGQNGGHGVDGFPGGIGKAGKEGRIAMGTHEKADVVCNCGHTAWKLKKDLASDNLFLQMIAFQQFLAHKMMHRCISEPGDGAPGEQGGAGASGGDGGRGGDSARIYVAVDDASTLQIKAYPIPGKGGTGGSGGRGGDGGRGGAPGNHNLDHFGNCRDAAYGPKGAPGDRGQPGQPAAAGNALPMCIKLGSTGFGDCDEFKTKNGGN
jgi:hypothetical protein